MLDRRITSRQNPRLKEAVALRERRARESTGRMVIEGRRELARAIARGVPLVDVFVDDAVSNEPEIRAMVDPLSAAGIEVWQVAATAFEKIAFGDRQEGIVAIAERPDAELSSLELSACPLVAVLDGIEKPGNVGAMLRSADGAGLDAVIVCGSGVDLWNPNVVRASLGTVFSVPTATGTPAAVAAWLRQQGLTIFAARPDATQDYHQVDLRVPAALVLGSEAAGLSGAWQGSEATPIRLPMRGVADSLNVSVAAAILFYEALRQRG